MPHDPSIRRRRDGSIDYDFYAERARDERNVVIGRKVRQVGRRIESVFLGRNRTMRGL